MSSHRLLPAALAVVAPMAAFVVISPLISGKSNAAELDPFKGHTLKLRIETSGKSCAAGPCEMSVSSTYDMAIYVDDAGKGYLSLDGGFSEMPWNTFTPHAVGDYKYQTGLFRSGDKVSYKMTSPRLNSETAFTVQGDKCVIDYTASSPSDPATVYSYKTISCDVLAGKVNL
jgi:hypothetical protein